MALQTTNPATGEILATFPELTDLEVQAKLDKAAAAFLTWKNTSFAERADLMRKVGNLFRENKERLGKLATLEMGKPVTQAIAEAEKCALACDYYADNAERILAPRSIATEAKESYVLHEPTGIILAVMPWNFPFWQVMRFAAPALMAGNVGVLKHASNVPQCAAAFEEMFTQAGFPEGVFQNLAIGSAKVEQVVRHPKVTGVALTGSEAAGSKVAGLAGSLIKTSVLELGGSDPFVVLADADIEYAAEMAAKGRLQNNGQSCIAAKRFIVEDAAYDAFLERFVHYVSSQVIGDPMDPRTTLGPVVNEQGRLDLERQIDDAVAQGAMIATGGKRMEGPGFFFEPTILTDITKDMLAYHEELFGPVACVYRVKDAEEALFVANDTTFGLGGSVWTKDLEKGKALAAKIRAGAVFVNAIVKSDPRVPFGGTGVSGFGRELAEEGIKEFVNVKTVWVA